MKNKIVENKILEFIASNPGFTSYGIGYKLELGDYDIEEGELDEILKEMSRQKLIERKFESSKDKKQFAARYYPIKKKEPSHP